MKLVTIQNKKVLNTLLNGKTHYADFNYIINSPFKIVSIRKEIEEQYMTKAYQILMTHYEYTSPPIFCCRLMRKSDFGDVKIDKNSVLLELYVPDDIVKLHRFDSCWKDIIHQVFNGRWDEDEGYEAFKDDLNGWDTDRDDVPIQAVIPYIKPEWLLSAYKIPDGFVESFSGGRFLLESDYKQIFTTTKIYEKYETRKVST